jgi:TolB-like protein/tetratricopeptide (TPR) repeat protein
MSSQQGENAPSKEMKESPLKSFLAKLRKRHIIETLAAFIGGGWLVYEIVHWVLVAHYHLPEKLLDITIITLLCALLCMLLWRWFSGREKPGKFKLELVLIPLVILITVLLDINLILHLKGPEPETIPTSKWKNSIAVLPFVDMSPQKDQEYFCDGMTEDLINRLSNIRDLKVPARTSAFMFKGRTPDMHDVGEKLKVQTALEGSVQKSGNRLRITAQLINIADGYHLWSEKYDRELKDVFVIQDEISSAIVDALQLKLTSQEKKRITGHPIDNAVAYEFYLKAHSEIWRFKENALDRIVQELQNALDITGPNALLYSAMADAYRQYVNIGVRQEEYLAIAEEYAKKALTKDPNLPKANAILGYLYEYRNQREGIRYFKKALATDPNELDALRRLALTYQDVGKSSAALPLIARHKKVDPLNLDNYLLQGYSYFYDGQFGLALEQFRKRYQSDPDNPMREFQYAQILALNKALDEAFSIIEKCARADPDNVASKFGLLLKYGLLKDKEKAFQIMTPDFRKTCQRDNEWSYTIADAFALLDEKEEALDWLENAVNRGFINYPFISERDPFLSNIRGEERFKKLMERVKYEWEHFEV